MWIKLASVPFKNFETLERVVLVDCFTLENLMVGFSNVSPGLKGFDAYFKVLAAWRHKIRPRARRGLQAAHGNRLAAIGNIGSHQLSD